MRRILKVVLLGVMTAGLGIFFYPNLAEWHFDRQTEQYIKAFKRQKNKTEDAYYQKAESYNQTIAENGQEGFYRPNGFQKPQIRGKKCFGYIKIPKMNTTLKLYLGASKDNMKKGAAVMGETSLPIGGKNTNSVIAAHRGYQGIPYFREIERLEINDKVSITNPWETLTYRVESICIIQPDNSDAVKIQKGKDMVTLMTCHPYRVGSKRYVVYCVRDHGQNLSEQKIHMSDTYFESSELDIQREKLFHVIGFGILIVLGISMVTIKAKQKRRKK